MAKKKDKGKQLAKANPATGGLVALEQQLADLESRFDQLLRSSWLASPWEMPELPELDLQMPRVDVLDKGKKLVVRAEIPGIRKEDVEVTVSDRALTIRGATRKEKKTEKENYIQREIVSGSFLRTVPLPAAVDGSRAKAKVKNGVLHVVLPKAEKESSNRIEVK
jgi:HSP20 family protein